MARREITQRIEGPNGNFTQSFGPETVRVLVDLGLIKLDTSEDFPQPQFDRVVELQVYKKA